MPNVIDYIDSFDDGLEPTCKVEDIQSNSKVEVFESESESENDERESNFGKL